MKKIFFILLTGLMLSCQTSKIISTWNKQNISLKKYSTVLVLGVMKDNDRDLQVKMENHLAGDLRELGYNAVAANAIFPAGTFIKDDTARAMAAINSKNFDAVLTIVLLDKVKEKYYVPGRMYYTPFSNNYNQFGRYYFTMEDRIYEPGYYTTDTKIFWESNFYDLTTRQMVYSAQTRSFDPGSKESLAHYYGVLISNNLVKKNILVKPLNPDGF